MSRKLRFAAIDLESLPHLSSGRRVDRGAECAGYCPETRDPRVLAGFRERFPELQPAERDRLFEDASIDVVVSAAIPRDLVVRN